MSIGGGGAGVFAVSILIVKIAREKDSTGKECKCLVKNKAIRTVLNTPGKKKGRLSRHAKGCG
jgi:hypothetical protein